MTTALRALERTKVKPILFSGPMVRALLDSRKTQTRRLVKPQPSAGVRRSPFVGSGIEDGHGREIKLRYEPGDLLWVRETWGAWPHMAGGVQADSLRFRADGEYQNEHGAWQWRPSIHMPKWASRLTLEVTAVKVERLQEISEEDAIAEGIEVDQSGRFLTVAWRNYAYDNHPFNSAVASFRSLWNSLNAKRGYGWEDNPWVIAVSFRVHKMNVDALLEQREAA